MFNDRMTEHKEIALVIGSNQEHIVLQITVLPIDIKRVEILELVGTINIHVSKIIKQQLGSQCVMCIPNYLRRKHIEILCSDKLQLICRCVLTSI